MGRAQTAPHAPQFDSLDRTSASQPLAGLASQSAKPSTQAPTAQRPATQVADALSAAHALAQAPQFDGLARRSTSHPSSATPLQSAKPSAHALTAQRPAAHSLAALGSAQTLPQAPQCARLARVSVSQPVAAMPSQSP